MSAEKSQQIIERAMADRAVYDEMAARESKVWGKILPARERSEARLADENASGQLNASRHQTALSQLAREKGLRFERGVSLGCGSGRLERALVQAGICGQMHGLDVSEDAVVEARAIAARENLPLTYETADLNFVQLPAKSFDLVVAQSSLHHVLFLERVAEQAWRALEDGGYLWIHDFIGESQGQYDEKRLALMNRLLEILPEKFRANQMTSLVVRQIRRAEPGNLVSPFEKIRCAEIVDVFERWFTIEWRNVYSAFLHLIAPPGTRASYVENADTKALYELLILLDQLCIEEGVLSPSGGQFLMRPKPAEEIERAPERGGQS